MQVWSLRCMQIKSVMKSVAPSWILKVGSTKAAMAANAKAGFGKDSNANPRFNFGGKLVNAKAGMEWKAKNAAMMDEDPSPYLDVPTTPDTQPDTPAASELSPTASLHSLSQEPSHLKKILEVQ